MYPFERNREYTLRQLLEFEKQLSEARRGDPALDDELRAPSPESPAWINKPRNDELIPLLFYARHTKVPDDATFCVMTEGNPTDVQIVISGKTINLQITLADPSLVGEGGNNDNPGYQRRLSMEHLNQTGHSFGLGPFKRSGGRVIAPDDEMTSDAEFMQAYSKGLIRAFENKKNYDGRGLTLLVHARAYCEEIPLDRFDQIVRAAAKNNLPKRFDRVCVLGRDEGYFVDFRAPGARP
jgi:hypothetical protein